MIIHEFQEFDDLTSPSTGYAGAAPMILEHDRLQHLIDNTPAIIYSSVPTGDFKMTFVSSNATNVLGYTPSEMVEDPNFWFNHIHPDDVPTIFSSLALLFTEGHRTYEYRFLNRSDEYIWMHDMLHLIRDEHGNPIEVVGSLTDITQRKRMEEDLQRKGEEQQSLIKKLQETQEQLLQSDKMASVGQLAAGVAHEINNPVGFVNSNMSSLQNYVTTLFDVIDQYQGVFSSLNLSKETQSTIASINKNAALAFVKEDVADLVHESLDGLKRVRDIVQSLKDFSHVGETEWQEADIHRGLDSTLNIVKNEIKYKAIVEKHYGSLPLVQCVISQLNQVFMNFLVNASHSIKEKGVITISTGNEVNDGEPWVWIEIGDTGCGIPKDHLHRIFEPFFTTKPIGSGTGLGLSLAYGIVNNHGGKITLRSVVGEGTCFTIHLPVYRKDKSSDSFYIVQ